MPVDGDYPRTDFDHFSHRDRATSDAAWRELRDRCPVAWTDANGGHWVVASYDNVSEAFRDWETFSSARTDPAYSSLTIGRSRLPPLYPEELDPPAWYPLRRILAELLSPAAVERLQPRVEHWVTRSIDAFIERGEAELAHDLAVAVPSQVTMEWLGWPEDEWMTAAGIFHEMARHANGSPGLLAAAQRFGWLADRIREELEARRRHPRNDAMSVIGSHEIDGEMITLDDAAAVVLLTIGGGVDTTTALTSAALVHLGQHADDRARLRDDPSLLDTATEEFLRVYPPARTHARVVARDADFAGCPMRAGDRVLLSEVSACHDEAAFPDADRFDLERFPNRHVAFGVGIHRCPGSHLARAEFRAIITQVLERLGDYVLHADQVIEYPNWAVIGGWGAIPVTFAPGPRRA